MKYLLLLLLVNSAVFAQPMLFELKDCPSSITYHFESEEEFSTRLYYDADKRLVKITGEMEYAELTAAYSTNRDTTIITINYTDDPESGPEIIKQLRDSQGKIILELYYENDQLVSENKYSYNPDGDLICAISIEETFSDTTFYQWNMSELIVKETYKSSGDELEINSYAEYKIDNNKKILQVTFFDCDPECMEIGVYASFNYDTPIKKRYSKDVIAIQKSGKHRTYTMNGRSMRENLKKANSVIIRKHEGKPVTHLKLK